MELLKLFDEIICCEDGFAMNKGEDYMIIKLEQLTIGMLYHVTPIKTGSCRNILDSSLDRYCVLKSDLDEKALYLYDHHGVVPKI